MPTHLLRTIARSTKAAVEAMRAERRRMVGIRRRRAPIDAYLASHPVRRLHLGAGPYVLPEWLNSDLEPQHPEVVCIDILEPLPFSDATFDRIYSEHLIEHVAHQEGAAHLRECHRILKPGGKIRVATPNLEFLVNLYARYPHNGPVEARYIDRTVRTAFAATGYNHAAFVLNNFFQAWGHRFIYDPSTMRRALERAGFGAVSRREVGESEDVHFTGLERHGEAIEDDINRMQTMVFEAVRE